MGLSNDHASVSESVNDLAAKLNFECLIRHHEKPGATVEEAVEAYGTDKTRLVKCLLFVAKDKSFVGAIVRGLDRVDIKALEKASCKPGLKMASPAQVKDVLGMDVGGVHILAFKEKNVPCFVDLEVFESKTVVGAAGTPYDSITFSPWQLSDVLGYTQAIIVKSQAPSE